MKYLSFILFVVVALMGCNKDEETPIINNDDDNLIGTWSLNENYKSYVNDSLQFQGVSDYTLGIQDGVMTRSFLGNSDRYYWVRNIDGTVMFLITERVTTSGGILASANRMQIELNEQNRQVWRQETLGKLPSGDDSKIVRVWTLNR